MSNKDLKLAIELAAKATGREEIAALGKEVGNLGPVSSDVEKETKALAQRLQQLGQQRDQIDAFNKSKDALTQLELATVLSRDKLESLRKVQASGAGDAARLAEQEKLLASEVKQLESQLIRQAATHTKLGAGLKQSGIDTRNLGTEQNRLQREITETATRTERLARELTGSKAAAASFAGSVGGVTTRLLALGAAYIGVDRLWESLKAMFTSGDQAERLSVQLKAVMGSIQGGAEATAWINKFATETPLQLDEVTQLFVRLKAFGLDPMDGSLQAIVDQTYKLGGSFEEAQGISLALGQAWAKQKLQGEEILQMIERGVPVWSMLEQVTGKNTAELQKLSEAGLLGRDTIKALMEEIGKQSAGAAAANMGLLSGLISNAKDNLEKFYRLVAENGALAWLKGQLATLNAEFARMAADGSLQQWAKRVSDAIVSTGEGIKSFVKLMYDWSGAIKFLGEAWLGLKIASWAGQVKTLYTQFIAIPAATTLAAGGIGAVGTASVITTGAIKLLGQAMKASLIALTVEGVIQIGRLGVALYDLVKAEQALRESRELQRKTSVLLEDRYSILSAKLGLTIRNMGDLDKAVADGKIHFDEATTSWAKGPAPLNAIGTAAKSTADYLDEVTDATRRTQAAANAELGDALKAIGLDFDQLEGRVSGSFKGIQTALDTLVKASNAGADTIKATMEKAFDAAKTKAEIDIVTKAMQTLHDQGKLVGQPYIDSLAQATAAAKKMATESVAGAAAYEAALKAQKIAVDEAYKKGQIGAEQHRQQVGKLNLELEKTTVAAKKNVAAADEMTQAYADFGMKSGAQLQEHAAHLKQSFETIRSGAQSIEQVRAAFLKYAEAELESAKANDRYADASLSAQAAALGLNAEFEALETSVNAAGKEALVTAAALDTLGSSAAKAGSNVSQASSSVGKHADDMKKLQEHTREASSGQLTFADTMLKSSEVTSMSLDTINTKMAEARDIWESSYNYLLKSNDGSTEWWSPFVEKQLLAQKHNMQILEQMQNLKVATEALSSAELPTARLVANAERAVRQADLLDSETLANFRAAIDSARQKMESLNSSASSTLSNLRDELDQMNQNYAAVEERRYQTQIAELRTKLAEAEAAGSKAAVSDLEQALSIADQLHQQKMAAIRAEAAEKQAAAQKEAQEQKKAAAAAPSTTPVASAASSSDERTIHINLGGKTATVKATTANATTLTDLLTELEKAGAITL